MAGTLETGRSLFNFDQPYYRDPSGIEWQFDTPEYREGLKTAAMASYNGLTPEMQIPLYNLGDQYYKDLGYTGQAWMGGQDQVNMSDGPARMTPEFEQWLQDQDYTYGAGWQGSTPYRGYFDKYGNIVGNSLQKGASDSGALGEFIRNAIGLYSLGSGFGALAGSGGGAGAIGAGAGAEGAAAADAAAGLLPEYGSTAAYEAGLGSGAAGATMGASGIPAYQAPSYGGSVQLAGDMPPGTLDSLYGEPGLGPLDMPPEAGSIPVGNAPSAGGSIWDSATNWLGKVWDGDPKALNQLRMGTGALGLLSSLINKPKSPSLSELKGQTINPLYNNWTESQQPAMQQFLKPREFVYQPPKLARGGPVHAQPCGCPMCGGGAVGYAEGAHVAGYGHGQADDVPANLSSGEYVIDADVVSALGNGNNAAGARVLDEMRQTVRRHKRAAPANKIPPKALSPLAYLDKATRKGR